MGLRLDYIWRHSAFKQSAELRNIRAARGIVDGSHDQMRSVIYESASRSSQVLRPGAAERAVAGYGAQTRGSLRAAALASVQ